MMGKPSALGKRVGAGYARDDGRANQQAQKISPGQPTSDAGRQDVQAQQRVVLVAGLGLEVRAGIEPGQRMFTECERQRAPRASDMLLSLAEPQQEQAIARMQIAIKVDSRPPRAMGARLSSRLRWWRRLEEV
jgi:hypothetical protein